MRADHSGLMVVRRVGRAERCGGSVVARMLERVISRRGKFSPGDHRARVKLQGIIPLPVTGNNRNIYDQGR